MMKRYTVKEPDGSVAAPEVDMSDILKRLTAFEDAYEDFATSQEAIPAELEKLKSAGKEKTVRYKEMFGHKLYNLQIAALFERHGIEG
jgi:hypothetical protein